MVKVIKMNDQTNDKIVGDGSWDNWTEKEERDFVIAFLFGFVGFFVVFFAVIGLIS